LRLTSRTAAQSTLLLSRAAEAIAASRQLSQAPRRYFTKLPPAEPPRLKCPSCDHPLHYDRSYVGGVNASHAEQWDYYTCASESQRYQYRHRTRRLTRVAR